jgi:hypothetical protein
MDDSSLMTIGKHKGKPLKAVPDQYWQWFVTQEWAEHWDLLLRYAEKRTETKFAPVRKKRKCVLTHYDGVFGNPDAWKFNDGSCPFDPDPLRD